MVNESEDMLDNVTSEAQSDVENGIEDPQTEDDQVVDVALQE